MPLVGKGQYSYGDVTIRHDAPSFALTIGSYCSIAQGCQVFAAANLRHDCVSTYPFYELHEWGTPAAYCKGNVTIGDDVWIGADVIIMGGCTIGTGAVVGAGAVVTRDVPPYAVVAGNPAVVKKMRFSADTIALLLESRWWRLSVTELKRYEDLLMSNDEVRIAEFARRVTW